MEKSKQNDSEFSKTKGVANEGFSRDASLQVLSPPSFQLQAKGLSSSKESDKSFESESGFDTSKLSSYGDLPNDSKSTNTNSNNLYPIDSPFQLKETENKTGLPDQLKSGVENLSGFSMDDVQVHYNSSKPAQLNAHAYAQGTDIHVASGQEKHLPHEAWHVAQQKQGRVQPTRQLRGKAPINDDKGLESEADVMGAKALDAGNRNSGDLKLKSISSRTAQLARTEDQLKNKIGAPKFKKIKDAGLVDNFIDETNARLLELRNMPHVKFDELIHEIKTKWLDREDDFEDEPEAQSWLGWGLKKLGLAKEKEGEIDLPEHVFKEGYSGTNHTKEQSLTPAKAEKVVKDKDEEEGSILEQGLKMITINVLDGDLFEKQEGEKGPGKYEVSGKKSLEASVEGVKGKVEIEAQFGKGSRKLKGSGTVGGKDSNLNFGGTLEGFGGIKGGASGEAEFNPMEGSAKLKGKAGASAGVSVDGSLQVLLKVKGKELGKAQLKGGLIAGVAGEVSGIFKFSDGEFVLATGGKLALGLGFSWNYKIVANTGLLGALGDGISSWASWGKQKIFG